MPACLPASLLSAPQVGDVVEGMVRNVRPYGVLVDLAGGVTCMLHVSQISSGRVARLESILREGDRVKVRHGWGLDLGFMVSEVVGLKGFKEKRASA